jgi:hypothetical protein
MAHGEKYFLFFKTAYPIRCLGFRFPLPNLVYSDYDDGGCGVMVLEDWCHHKFKLDQPDLMRHVDPGM